MKRGLSPIKVYYQVETGKWRKVEFKIQDVVVPEIPGPFCTFKANSVPLFVEGSQFTDIRHYGKIMGYDKPVDLLWDHEMNMTKSEAERIRAENKENWIFTT